jgi:hypothetical protein
VYRELRAVVGAWARENGCKRQPRSDANWIRPLGNGENLVLSFRCNAWGGGAIGGNFFHGTIQTEPARGAPGSAINRQSDIALCLLQEELDELRELQNAINGKRPRTPELVEWMREDSPVGERTRELYKEYGAGEKPYRVGDFVTFGYFGIDDVRRHTWFLVRRLPDIVARFLEGRVATPNPVPQPAVLARLYPKT